VDTGFKLNNVDNLNNVGPEASRHFMKNES